MFLKLIKVYYINIQYLTVLTNCILFEVKGLEKFHVLIRSAMS